MAIGWLLARNQFLTSGDQMALNHNTKNPAVTFGNLLTHLIPDLKLSMVLLEAVGMTEINHDVIRKTCLLQGIRNVLNTDGIVIRTVIAAPENDMTVLVSRR